MLGALLVGRWLDKAGSRGRFFQSVLHSNTPWVLSHMEGFTVFIVVSFCCR